MTKKEQKAKKAAYMREYYRRKKNGSKNKILAQKHTDFLHALGDKVLESTKDLTPKYITIENDKWFLKGTGSLSELREILDHLEGK